MWAFLFALKEACRRRFSELFFLSDAKGVLKAINGKEDWALKPIILENKSFVFSYGSVMFCYVPRSIVEATHQLAKYCYYLGKSFCWDGDFLIVGSRWASWISIQNL